MTLFGTDFSADPLLQIAVLLGAAALDRFVGEYRNALHPVVWFGTAVSWAEKVAPKGKVAALFYGAGMALGLPALFTAATWGLLRVPVLGLVAAVYLLKGTISLRALGQAGEGVARPLAAGDLVGARYGLRSLCSRDATNLESDALAAGAVESLAENTSDAWVAPLFWFAVAGVPGAVFYRVVNTLDSRIGYHGKYEYLGKASARLDDLLNLIPARVTAGLLLVAGAVCSEDAGAGWRVARRDAGLTESPNAGWPMAAMAGMLGVVLEKAGCYRLGGEGRAPGAGDVDRAWKVVLWAGRMAVLGVGVAVLLRG